MARSTQPPSEEWLERSEFRALRRAERLPNLLRLRNDGFRVIAVNYPYHFRVNERLDIYITNSKWHDLKTGKRGRYKYNGEIAFVKQFFGSVGETNGQ